MPFVVKIKFEDDTRRITLDSIPKYEELVQLLRQLFPNAPNQFSVKYQDEDEDMVTISSDMELQEAVRVASLGSNKVIRLFITGNRILSLRQS